MTKKILLSLSQQHNNNKIKLDESSLIEELEDEEEFVN